MRARCFLSHGSLSSRGEGKGDSFGAGGGGRDAAPLFFDHCVMLNRLPDTDWARGGMGGSHQVPTSISTCSKTHTVILVLVDVIEHVPKEVGTY